MDLMGNIFVMLRKEEEPPRSVVAAWMGYRSPDELYHLRHKAMLLNLLVVSQVGEYGPTFSLNCGAVLKVLGVAQS